MWISETTPDMSFRPERSGAEESTTLGEGPTQDKICDSGRFLGSLCSLGMTCRYVIPFNRTGCIRDVSMAMNHRRYIAYSVRRTGCSGGNLPPWIFEFVTTNEKTYVIPTAATAEWRNPPRWRKNQHKIKLAAWEDSSTRFRSLGMTCRGDGSVQPHRLYPGRGGRQVAAPTSKMFRFF